MTKEVFKPVVGYEGLYEVSNLGIVKSLPRTIVRGNGSKLPVKERILKQGLSSNGYLTVSLHKDKKPKTHRIHQLVAMAFLNHKPNGFKGLVVDHKTNNKLDNRVENLQLISQRENASKDKKRGSSKYVGVCWHKKNRNWVARIKINGKKKHLGSFTCELEAHEAYQKALNSL